MSDRPSALPRDAADALPTSGRSAFLADSSSRLPTAVMTLFLLAVTVQAAEIFDVLWNQAQFAAFVVQIVILAFYLSWRPEKQNYHIQLYGAAVIVYLVWQHLFFVYLSHSPVNLNALASYLPLISFVVFFRSRLPLSVTLRILVVIGTGYLALYDLGHDFFLSMASKQVRSFLGSGDAERGTRLYLAGAYATYVAFYALLNRRGALFGRIVMMVLSLVAIWLSGSRTFQVLFCVIMALTLFRVMKLGTRIALFAIFAAVASVILLGLFVPGFNPFELFASDASGYARALEYGYAVEVVRHNWLFGLGIPGSAIAQQDYLHTPAYEPFYPADLGAIGPWVTFGLPGMVAFFAASYLCIVRPMIDRLEPEMKALGLTCVLCGMSGIISPSIILEQNTMFLSLLIVARIRPQRFGPGAARTIDIDGSEESFMRFPMLSSGLPRGLRERLPGR